MLGFPGRFLLFFGGEADCETATDGGPGGCSCGGGDIWWLDDRSSSPVPTKHDDEKAAFISIGIYLSLSLSLTIALFGFWRSKSDSEESTDHWPP